MSSPSPYEIEQWRAVQRFTGRPLSGTVKRAGAKVLSGIEHLHDRADTFLETRPKAKAAVEGAQERVVKVTTAVSDGAKHALEAAPDWTTDAVRSVRSMVTRASRVGLSASRMVRLHQKKGHAVSTLADLRGLDLQEIDRVRGSGAARVRGGSWYYPAAAALSGAGAAFVITGGEIVGIAGAGAAAAPGFGVIAASFAADAAIVLSLSSRTVSHVSLFYGYDPDDLGERLFVMSVLNAATALSSGAKAAAMRDISTLTQALARGKTWQVLNESVVSKVASSFAEAFSVRLTKDGLGKVVPLAGVVIGASMNWATLEGIVDAADAAYRRRFLLEKYPDLAEQEDSSPELGPTTDGADDAPISVIDQLSEVSRPETD